MNQNDQIICKQKYCKNHEFCIFTFILKLQYFILGKHEIPKQDLKYIYIYIYEILLYTTIYVGRLKTNSMFHTYDTRSKSDLFISGHNTKLFEQSITYFGMLIYYKRPHEIKSVTCIVKFKKMIINLST